ncbi:MAG: hypothetical protein ACOCSD_07895 [Halolamina sp.]
MVPSFRDVGRCCHRYGPGRLPRADERAVGAGYAGASAAFVAALLFAAVMTVADALGMESARGLVPFGLAATPLIVPGAFVAGWLTWRKIPTETAYFGPIAGTIAVFVTYLLSFLVALFAFVFTCWLTVPLGAASGWVSERARAATA